MKKEKTIEPQYQMCLELRDRQGLTPLGIMSNFVWDDDPRRLTFTLSRYKFVAKMFSGMNHVLEIGCADAFGTRIVLQEVKRVTAVDFDPVFVNDANRRMNSRWKFTCSAHDILKGPVEGKFDGVFAIDMLEHIPKSKERTFLKNVCASLSRRGAVIIGTPSLESQKYASPQSKEGHVNCKSHKELKNLLFKFFHHVFLFSMNDEVVHTGFYPMAHYLMALCCSKKL